MSNPTRSLVSVIVPVHNSARYIPKCLGAINKSDYDQIELIVVDDGSRDDSASLAESLGAIVLKLDTNSGQARARNIGAQKANGNILVFIDSDVVIQPTTITQIVESFQANPQVVALFGSYDQNPPEQNFVSQYRNLFHHYTHQNANPDAVTFWTGCGAIYRDLFLDLGGFDESYYAMEDIELGYRIHQSGKKILLDKNLLVTHLKQWTFLYLIKTDFSYRAVPWSNLILRTGFIPKELNLKTTDRLSAVLVGISVLLLLLIVARLLLPTASIIHYRWLLPALLLVFIAIAVLNHRLYSFFLQKRGLGFMLLSIPMHVLYYLISAIGFIYSWVGNHLKKAS